MTGVGDTVVNKQAYKINKGVIFKNCAPFTNCKSETNNSEIDNAKNIDIVMAMYNLINVVIILQKHLEVCGNTTEMKQLMI